MVLGKLLFCGMLMGGSVLGGYYWGVAVTDCHPYRVEKRENAYVLYDKEHKKELQILDGYKSGLQLGNTTHRADGVLEDLAQKPDTTWQALRSGFESNFEARKVRQ